MIKTLDSKWFKVLTVAVSLSGVFWVFGGCASPDKPSEPAASAARQAPARTPAHPPRPSPFLASHETQSAKPPAIDDVDPSFHVGIEQLRKRISDDPADASSMLELAHLLHDAHQTEEAIVEYQRYLALEPNSRAAWLDLAKAHGSIGQWDDALAASDSLLVRLPDDPSGLYNKGAVLANLNRLDEAREVWLRVQQQQVDPEMQKMAELALSSLKK